MKPLARPPHVDDYLRLTERAHELFGPQAVVTHDGYRFFVRVFPDTAAECLGINPLCYGERLQDLADIWYRWWRSRPCPDDAEQDYWTWALDWQDWWDGKPKRYVSPPEDPDEWREWSPV